VVTTLVTSESRSLTEVKLVVKNQGQPFLKVGLPAGASILSAEVAGEKVKPVQGTDGSRVPLLRPGLRISGPYQVSYVFMHAGAPFAQKGDSELSLPGMDIPISLLQWEVFLPETYKVKNFGGNAIPADRLPPATGTISTTDEEYSVMEQVGAWPIGADANMERLLPGQMGGILVDESEGGLPGASISVTNQSTGLSTSAYSDAAGRWVVSNLPSGTYKVTASLTGFQTSVLTDVRFDANRPLHLNRTLKIAARNETIEVSANDSRRESQRIDREAKKSAQMTENLVSSNVVNLQRRVTGILPIRVDVPRTGNSYKFVRPLVLDEETRVTFRYRSKQSIGSAIHIMQHRQGG